MPCGFDPTGCRSACSSSGAPSTRRRCCAPPTPTSRRPTGTRATSERLAMRRRTTSYEAVIGLEVHAAAADAHQDVLRLQHGVRRAAEHPDLPGLPGHAGHAAGAQPPGGGVRDPRRRWRSNCSINAAQPLPPQELLLPGPAEGYQIIQYDEPLCRSRPRSTIDVDGEHARDPHPARAPGGGRGQATRTRAPRRRAVEPRRLQPRRRAADGDRHRAGHPLGRRRRAAYLLALRADRCVYIGVCDGKMEEGSLRCEPTSRCARAGATELGTKVEIKNLNSFRDVAAGARGRDRAADRRARARRALVQETRLWDADAA